MQDNWPKHVVAAGLLVRKDGHVLLVRTPRRGWEFPGGQIELGEAVTDGAIREVVEEANVVATVDALVGVYSNVGASRVLFDFLGSWVDGEGSVGDETIDVAWVSPEEALDMIEHPLYNRRFRQMQAYDGRVLYQSYSNDPYRVHAEKYI